MLVIDCVQGSEEWHKSRIGLVSGSRFKDIMTEPQSKAAREAGDLSQTAESYLDELVAAILTGQSPEIKGAALDWGHEYESVARDEYEFLFDACVAESGIVVHDNCKVGASPDGFVGDDGMIEIKCPFNSKNHIATVRSGEMPKEHIPQVQGNMWINGRRWCDFISFDPRLPIDHCQLFVVRVHRDDAYIAVLEKKVLAFVEKLDSVLREKFGYRWAGVKNPKEGSE